MYLNKACNTLNLDAYSTVCKKKVQIRVGKILH